MAIAFDASSQGSNNNATSLTVSHTVGSGSDRVLYVFIASDDGTDDLAGTTVTYGGTSLGSPLTTVSVGGTNWLYIWRMIAPTSGTANIVATAATNTYLSMIASSWTGVDQTTPNGTITTAGTGNASSPRSLSATAATGGVVVDFLHRRAVSALTMDGSQTRIGTDVSAVVGTSGSSYKAGSGSVAMVWTHTSGGGISTTHMAVPLNEASGGGGSSIAAIANHFNRQRRA